MKSHITAAALLALGSTAYAQTSQKCQNNVCFSLNIPDATASSGNGDIFFQISAPTSMTWVALGQGSSMSGSNIFVLYQNSAGTNVTVSPRLGTGQSEPKYSNSAQISILDGSGVSNGQMVANIKCSNCNSWSGGSADFTSSAGSWIWAYKSGSALKDDSTSASISQHGSRGTLSFDYSSAKGGNSVNPFSSSSGSGTSGGSSGTATATACSRKNGSGSSGTGTQTSDSSFGTSTDASNAPPWASRYSGFPTSRPTNFPSKRADDDDDCDDSGSSSGNGSGSGNGGNSEGFGLGGAGENQRMMLIAHGVLACMAFAIFFPAGGIAIRAFSFPGLVWVHAAMQAFAYLTYIAAFGLGVYLASNMRMLNKYHPVIGIVLFILIFFQPVLGFLHHSLFKKYNRRTFWSYAHLWLGRFIITLGIINGGLGFLLANNSRTGAIVYGVIAGLVWIVYVAVAIRGELKRSRAPPQYTESMASNSDSPSNIPREYYGGGGAPKRTSR